MPGAAPRLKGANAERALVRWLRETGHAPDARRYLAGDGRQPGDIDALPGLCLEVKARDRCAPGGWMIQAESQAAGRLAVVVYHPPGVADPGQWVAMLRFDEFLTLWQDR